MRNAVEREHLALWLDQADELRRKRPKHILFLCVANSARSQMAEGIARSLASIQVQISSAGSEPDRVRPEAIEVLAEIGVDISSHRSKGLDELDTSTVDTVITLCGDEVCPVYLGGAARLHWDFPDPATSDGGDRLEKFRIVRDDLFLLIRRVLAGMH